MVVDVWATSLRATPPLDGLDTSLLVFMDVCGVCVGTCSCLTRCVSLLCGMRVFRLETSTLCLPVAVHDDDDDDHCRHGHCP